ncbi:MAG: universal stress protein [Planctomycetaceae bacterium]|nr:universal stress protein [Planctomycetaceae bacterium]
MRNFNDVPVIAPTDFSVESDRGVVTAIELAGTAKHVTVIHVTPPILIVEPVVVYDTISDEERRANLELALRERYSSPEYEGVNLEVRIGDPGSEIVKLAKEKKAGLIVMPSHGRTGLTHLLLGSVAERVVRTAECPVLVVRK